MIDKIKSYQFNHAAMCPDKGLKIREMVADADSGSDSDTESEAVQVRRARTRDRKSSSSFYRSRDNPPERAELNQRLKSLETELGALRGELLQAFKNLESKNRSRSPSSSPNRSKCYECGGQGHFRAECPSRKVDNRPAKRVHFPEDTLNSKGSGNQA